MSPLINFSNKLAQKVRPYHFYFLMVIYVLASFVFQNGGIIHPEISTRMPVYLSGRPLLETIFDPNVMEIQGKYRPRQLSYFFDFLDAKFIEWCIVNGWPHFLSLTHYIGCLLIAMLLWQFLTKKLKLEMFASLCILALFVFSPGPFLAASFFRSAKIGVALMLCILFILIWPHMRIDNDVENQFPFKPAKKIIIFLCAVVASLFDEQGFFVVCLAAFFSWLHYENMKSKHFLSLAMVFAMVTISILIYNYYLSPLITYGLNGYYPDFHYQFSLPWERLFSLFFLQQAILFLIDNLRFFLGNFTQLQAAFVLLAMGWLIDLQLKKIGNNSLKEKRHGILSAYIPGPRLYFPLLLIGLIILNLVMVARHPLISIGVAYYGLPVLTVLVIITSLVVNFAFGRGTETKAILRLGLIIMILGNLAGLPDQARIMSSRAVNERIYTARMLDALWNMNDTTHQEHSSLKTDPLLAHFKKLMR
ncbi:MAG TPA: hypothetical protein P5244_03215 [Syntrophales bacterium]|nr:hypothetical protein [Syntrophales bacterium]